MTCKLFENRWATIAAEEFRGQKRPAAAHGAQSAAIGTQGCCCALRETAISRCKACVVVHASGLSCGCSCIGKASGHEQCQQRALRHTVVLTSFPSARKAAGAVALWNPFTVIETCLNNVAMPLHSSPPRWQRTSPGKMPHHLLLGRERLRTWYCSTECLVLSTECFVLRTVSYSVPFKFKLCSPDAVRGLSLFHVTDFWLVGDISLLRLHSIGARC